MICQAEIADVAPVSWKDPLSAVVTAAIKGKTASGQPIAVRLVEDPGAQVNASLVSVLIGERWHVCASQPADATPVRGTVPGVWPFASW